MATQDTVRLEPAYLARARDEAWRLFQRGLVREGVQARFHAEFGTCTIDGKCHILEGRMYIAQAGLKAARKLSRDELAVLLANAVDYWEQRGKPGDVDEFIKYMERIASLPSNTNEARQEIRREIERRGK